jgi:ubiquinone/menaquinone biosynthesis C-methylase UbiE
MTAVAVDPAVYELWLGAATDLMLDQAGVGPGSRVLDVAAGAGGQTLAAAARSGPEGLVLATDISGPLIDQVRANAIDEGATHVYAIIADAERLDGEPGAFDAAICRFGLTCLPDVGAALRGIHMSLRPGGRMSAIVFAEREHNPLFESHEELFSLSSPGVLETALAEAGFVDIEVERVDAPLSVPCQLLVAGGRRI